MKVYASEPIRPAAITATIPQTESSLFSPIIIFLARCVIVQKRNIMVKALARADIILTISATLETSPAKREKTRDRIINVGAPGGCPGSSL